MLLIEKLFNFISKKNQLIFSNLTHVSTRYGLLQMKAYKTKEIEYLVLMSKNFDTSKDPILYIHSDLHGCDPHDQGNCYCNNQMVIALKTIQRGGGLIIYPSINGNSIDGLLEEMNATKLNLQENTMNKETINLNFKADSIEYHSLCLILQSLQLSNVKLVTSDIKTIAYIKRLGINVLQRVPTISFSYGKR